MRKRKKSVVRHMILEGARAAHGEGQKVPALDLGITRMAVSAFEWGMNHSERLLLYYIHRYHLTDGDLEKLIIAAQVSEDS